MVRGLIVCTALGILLLGPACSSYRPLPDRPAAIGADDLEADLGVCRDRAAEQGHGIRWPLGAILIGAALGSYHGVVHGAIHGGAGEGAAIGAAAGAGLGLIVGGIKAVTDYSDSIDACMRARGYTS
ncbi:MAG: hypothetical protein KIT81_00555 [Alphaproteobacteria bacterium]|nr:hypothetical protein [Alphaproteobacteria bacterium]